MKKDFFIIDSHIHFDLSLSPEKLVKILDATSTDMACLVTVPHRQRLSSVPDALMMKSMYPGRFYVFGGLDWSVFYTHPDRVGEKMREYSSNMLKAGCDGIKIIEGKPNMRKELPIPDWNSPVWSPFFEWAEEEQIPVLWHLNDPETFWNIDTAPAWAREKGWFYGPEYINNEEQYIQVLSLLKKHPRLKVCFAHFLFLSADLDRLSRILREYENLRIDITPGAEMYENFSKSPQKTAAFFEEFGDRILYGTDIAGRCILGQNGKLTLEESVARVNLTRSFLTKKGLIDVPADGFFLCSGREFVMNSPGFSKQAQRRILGENFTVFAGKAIKTVSPDEVLNECRRIRAMLPLLSSFDRRASADTSCIDTVEEYFMKL